MNDSFINAVVDGISYFSDKYPEYGLAAEELDPSLYKTATDLMSKFLTNFSSHVNAGEYLYVIID